MCLFFGLVFSRLWDPEKSKKPWQRIPRGCHKVRKKHATSLQGYQSQPKLLEGKGCNFILVKPYMRYLQFLRLFLILHPDGCTTLVMSLQLYDKKRSDCCMYLDMCITRTKLADFWLTGASAKSISDWWKKLLNLQLASPWHALKKHATSSHIEGHRAQLEIQNLDMIALDNDETVDLFQQAGAT